MRPNLWHIQFLSMIEENPQMFSKYFDLPPVMFVHVQGVLGRYINARHTYSIYSQYTPAVAVPFIKIAITNPQEHSNSLVGIIWVLHIYYSMNFVKKYFGTS